MYGCTNGADDFGNTTYCGGSFGGGGGGYVDGGGGYIGGGSGGSGGRAPNPGDTKTTVTKKDAAIPSVPCPKGGQAATTVGNPVVFSTGNKVEPETDFASGGQAGLSLTHTYDGYWDGIGIFGRRWLSNYDYKLLFTTDDPTSACYPRPGNGTCDPTGQSIWAQRPDGRKIKFNYATSPSPGWYEDKPSPIAKIIKTGSAYQLLTEENRLELYDSAGFPTQVTSLQGIGWTFSYDSSHYLTRVANNAGRHVDFTWNNGLLSQVTDPAGNAYTYTYKLIALTNALIANQTSANQTSTISTQGRYQPMRRMDDPDDPPARTSNPIPSMVALLTGAVLPGSPQTTITYYYEDSRFPTALTGKAFNGTRYSTFAYDASRRATDTYHAGNVEHYIFTYATDDSGQITRAIVTNPLGRQVTHTYINGKEVSENGAQSANCAASNRVTSYDDNGYPNGTTDFNGNPTVYTYNAKGQLQERVDAAGQPQERTTDYVWDEANNRVTKETLVGDHETSYVYGTDNRLASVAVKNLSSKVAASSGQIRTTAYTYSIWSNGLLSAVIVDGPLTGSGDAITTTYSQAGDLLTVKNSLGQTTTYDGYNDLGLPRFVTGPNGDKTGYIYDARGRTVEMQTYRNGVTQHTYYEYDGFGRLAKVTRPDGQYHGYQYDVAGRLISEYEPEVGGTFEQKVYTYNAMSLPIAIRTQRTFSEPRRGTVP